MCLQFCLKKPGIQDSAVRRETDHHLKIGCQDAASKGVTTKLFFWPVPGSGTLMKHKNHSMGVGGLLVRELEREKDLKAEKD